jgi:hypothetical protein
MSESQDLNSQPPSTITQNTPPSQSPPIPDKSPEKSPTKVTKKKKKSVPPKTAEHQKKKRNRIKRTEQKNQKIYQIVQDQDQRLMKLKILLGIMNQVENCPLKKEAVVLVLKVVVPKTKKKNKNNSCQRY